MDNGASINQNKGDSLKRSPEDKGIKGPDGVGADQSLIEVKPDIPVVDLLEAEEKTMVNADPAWLKKYETCEEVTANGEGEKTVAKKESSEEDKTNKTTAGSKRGALKSEADTLIIEIDNTDILDAYLERSKNKVMGNADKNNLVQENLENNNKAAAECTPAKTNETEVKASSTPDKIGDSVLASANESKKKTTTKKRSSAKATSLSDEAEKIARALQQKSDSKEVTRKKVAECQAEPVNNSDNHKDQVEMERKPSVEEKPAELAVKSEEKKIEPRFIWISNISKNTKATDLKVHLTTCGKVTTAKIVTDGKLYYGYVVMERRDDVDNCIKNLDETVFEGRKIRLSDRIPERKTTANKNNPNAAAEQVPVKTEPISPEQIDMKNVPEVKPEKEKAERKRRRSRSHDPLTLKVKAPPRRFDRSSEERRRRKNEEMMMLRRSRDEEERRRREIEREREERRKQKIREEEHRQTELKLERERKKLEREREIIEREKLDLIRLQKKLADTERYMLSRQKVEIERNIRSISDDYKKRKSPPGDFVGVVTKTKFGRVEAEESRRPPPENKEYWKSRSSPVKAGKKECFEMVESYPTKKSSMREDNAGVTAPPPPRILNDNFDMSDRRRKEKERDWGGESRGGYEKKEFSTERRPVFKDRKPIDAYDFGDRRECVVQQEKSYNREQRYKSKYEKSPTGSNWEKFPSAPYKSVPSSSSWRNDVVRVVQRHPPNAFPVPPQFGSASGMAHYYPQVPDQYSRQNEFYGRPPERKY